MTNDYEIGYGKPPKKRRFKPGQSGNPRGRPPRPIRRYSRDQISEDFLASLEEKITVIRDGKKTKIPIIQAIYDQLVLKAAKGDFRSAKLVVELQGAIIDGKEKSFNALIETVIERDKHYSRRADQALPHEVDEIRADQADFRASPIVQDALTRIDRPMPRRGKLTPAEEALKRSSEPIFEILDLDPGES